MLFFFGGHAFSLTLNGGIKGDIISVKNQFITVNDTNMAFKVSELFEIRNIKNQIDSLFN